MPVKKLFPPKAEIMCNFPWMSADKKRELCDRGIDATFYGLQKLQFQKAADSSTTTMPHNISKLLLEIEREGIEGGEFVSLTSNLLSLFMAYFSLLFSVLWFRYLFFAIMLPAYLNFSPMPSIPPIILLNLEIVL